MSQSLIPRPCGSACHVSTTHRSHVDEQPKPTQLAVTLRELSVPCLSNPRQREGPRHESKNYADMMPSRPADCRTLDDVDIDVTVTLSESRALKTLDPTAANLVSELLPGRFIPLSTAERVVRF
ncbi:hypothetical protein CGRA01v4_07887 [Colletotrichum graminicola]|nr:hypothetical protein CGRA01v4_07887 [Colletotrichum graminicola]